MGQGSQAGLSREAARATLDYSELAEAYARHRQVHPGVLAGLIDAGAISAETRVLEIGCGTGNYCVALSELTGCATWALDPSPTMLAKATLRSGAVIFQAGRGEELPFPPDSFDLAFSVDVIHHVADRAAFYRAAYRVLRPGGRLCTVTDSAEIIRSRQPLSSYFPETVAPELQRYGFSRPDCQIAALMQAAGFHLLDPAEVEVSYTCDNIAIYRDRAFSCLHLISDEAFTAGIRRMEADLARGPLPCVARYLIVWGQK